MGLKIRLASSKVSVHGPLESPSERPNMNRLTVNRALQDLQNPSLAIRRTAVMALRSLLLEHECDLELRVIILAALDEKAKFDDDEEIGGLAAFSGWMARKHR